MPVNQRFYKLVTIQFVIVVSIVHFEIMKLEFLLRHFAGINWHFHVLLDMTGGKTIKMIKRHKRGHTLFLGLCWQRLKFAAAARGGGHEAPVAWGLDAPGHAAAAVAVAVAPVDVAPAPAGAARELAVVVPALAGIAAGGLAGTAAVELARNAFFIVCCSKNKII